MGADYIDTLCLVCAKILDSKKENVFSINHIVCSVGEPLLPVREVETFPKSKSPDTSWVPTLHAGIFNSSSLKPAVLTLSYTLRV